jgi:hypothetical protein
MRLKARTGVGYYTFGQSIEFIVGADEVGVSSNIAERVCKLIGV